MVWLQLVLDKYGKDERGDEADTLGNSDLPRCSVGFSVTIDISCLVEANLLNIECNCDRLCHNCNSRTYKIHSSYIKITSLKPEGKWALIFSVRCSLCFFDILRNLCYTRFRWLKLGITHRIFNLCKFLILSLVPLGHTNIRVNIILIHINLGSVVSLLAIKFLISTWWKNFFMLIRYFDFLFLLLHHTLVDAVQITANTRYTIDVANHIICLFWPI